MLALMLILFILSIMIGCIIVLYTATPIIENKDDPYVYVVSIVIGCIVIVCNVTLIEEEEDFSYTLTAV